VRVGVIGRRQRREGSRVAVLRQEWMREGRVRVIGMIREGDGGVEVSGGGRHVGLCDGRMRVRVRQRREVGRSGGRRRRLRGRESERVAECKLRCRVLLLLVLRRHRYRLLLLPEWGGRSVRSCCAAPVAVAASPSEQCAIAVVRSGRG